MLVDAAKHGDVEIPVFCYEPKLGAPVGACRMCLVEVEGIPKLQTGCSTPVKDGMVVHTQTDRVKHAQEAVVEFLLVNHPLDCPVCDKGGECPLQDISFGWGGGRSRFIEPKRHFQKPLALSPLVAIDRERCILCYRCVRFSQEISEDYQLVLRGARRAHLRLDLRRAPLRRAVQRQHHRAVPGGRADLAALPLPRAPVGHRGLGLGVHAVPGAVQRHLHRARRARPARARARQRRGRRRLAVRQGPLRLPVDPRRRAHHRADDPRRRRAAPGLLGARARRGGVGARARQGPRRRDRRRRDDQRGGLPPAAPAARGPGLARPRLARRRHAAARAAPRARRARRAGHGRRPRVRPRRPRARLRARRRHADRRPAHPQGRAPPRRQARGGHEPPVVAGPQRGRERRASRPAAGEAFLAGAVGRAAGRAARRGRPPRAGRGRRLRRAAHAGPRAAGRRRTS